MNKSAFLVLLALAGAVQASPDPREAAARELIARFSQQLRSALESAMQAGGPLNAVSVCHEQAPLIAQAVAGGGDWQLRRTALRVRNPANAPDAWERTQLNEFLRQREAGADISTLSAQADGPDGWRYMQAIGTAPLCTVCHGPAIDPALQAHIQRLYPKDAATGFVAGSVRGAFSLRLPPATTDAP